VHYASPAAQALLGRAPESLLGTSVFGLIHPDDLGTASAEFKRDPRDGTWRR
jgi:PAS domain-containing protein